MISVLLSVIASFRPPTGPAPWADWTGEDWTIAGVVVAVIALIASIVVPIELHRREKRSGRELREEEEHRKRLAAKRPAIEAILAGLGDIDHFAQTLRNFGGLSIEEISEFWDSDKYREFQRNIRACAELIFPDECADALITFAKQPNITHMPRLSDLTYAMDAWQNGAEPNLIYVFLLHFVDANPKQRAEGVELAERVAILRKYAMRALREID